MLVKFFATYRQITGCRTMEMPACEDVLALLHELSRRWPDFRPLLVSIDGTDVGDDAIVLVNGRHIDHLDGAQTKLCTGDSVALTPLVAGG